MNWQTVFETSLEEHGDVFDIGFSTAGHYTGAEFLWSAVGRTGVNRNYVGFKSNALPEIWNVQSIPEHSNRGQYLNFTHHTTLCSGLKRSLTESLDRGPLEWASIY